MKTSYARNKIEDYIGKKYGHLTVVGEAPKTHRYSNLFVFQCDCGNTTIEQPSRVISGHKSTCGKCEYANRTLSPHFDIEDYIGKKNNMLTVVGVAEKKPTDEYWKLRCSCECGRFINLTPSQFSRGLVKSCGCLRGEGYLAKDNRTSHPLYGIWNQMMSRCYKETTRFYNRYGGRGIKVCEEWHDFWNFVKWSDSVGGRPDGLEIDRIDNDGPYAPWNCRWATRYQQLINRSNNVRITFNGKTQTLVEWSKELDMSYVALNHRYQRGWDVERMLTTPVKKKNVNTTKD